MSVLDQGRVGGGGRGAELRRRLRETGGRGRKLRGLAQLLAPYRWRVLAMFASLVLATAAALAPAPLAKVAIDQGIQKHDVGTLDVVVVARRRTSGQHPATRRDGA